MLRWDILSLTPGGMSKIGHTRQSPDCLNDTFLKTDDEQAGLVAVDQLRVVFHGLREATSRHAPTEAISLVEHQTGSMT